MRRIGYLVSQYPAPSHTFIRREIEALRRRGIDVRSFSVRRPDPDARLSDADRSELEQTTTILPVAASALVAAHFWALARAPWQYLRTAWEAWTHRTPGVATALRALFYLAEAMVLAHALVHQRIDRLHCHFANAGATVGFLSALYLNLPFSLTLHGTSDLDPPAGPLLPRKVARAQFVACASFFLRAQAMRLCSSREWGKLFVSRCGVERSMLPQRVVRSDRASVILCVGRLSPEKGQLGLVEAFAALVARVPDARLEFVGDGPERSELLDAIRRHALEDRCIWRGQLPESDTLAAIASAGVLVSASFLEGLPVVLMEAMAIGVPVVAPRVAGIPELVDDGVNGLLFTPSDWIGLAAALERVLTDPALAARLAAAGKRRMETEFEVDIAVVALADRLAGGAAVS